jgi:hypothetical protein
MLDDKLLAKAKNHNSALGFSGLIHNSILPDRHLKLISCPKFTPSFKILGPTPQS